MVHRHLGSVVVANVSRRVRTARAGEIVSFRSQVQATSASSIRVSGKRKPVDDIFAEL
jgi:hypothetical protein